jgi:hypothetical protein
MFIPDPIFLHPGSEFCHPGSRIRIKEFKYFNPKIVSKLKKYDHSGSRIRILTFYPSRILDPGVKKAPDPGPGSVTLKNSIKMNQQQRNTSWKLVFQGENIQKMMFTSYHRFVNCFFFGDFHRKKWCV